MKKSILFFAFACWIFNSKAQWVQTNGPFGGQVNCFTESGGNIIAGTLYGGIYLSANNGNSWTQVNLGLSINIQCSCFAVSGSNIFLGTLFHGIYLSTNNGNSWSQVNSGLSSLMITSIVINGTNIFAGTGVGVYLSTNNGSSWSPVNTGLTDTAITAMVTNGLDIFAGTSNGGVFRSINNGSSWSSAGLGFSYITTLFINGTSLFAGTWWDGVFRSNNNGSSWSNVNSTLTHISSFASNGTYIFVSSRTGGGIYRSANNGNSWQSVNSGLINLCVNTLYVSGASLFAGHGNPGGMSRSINNGNSWTPINDGFKQLSIKNLVKTGSNLIATPSTFASCGSGGVFLSTDNGNSWSAKGLSYYEIESLAASGSNIFAGTRNNGLYLSTDSGLTWTQKGFNNLKVFSLTLNNTDVFASAGTYSSGCTDGALYTSVDSGNTWIADTAGMGPVAATSLLIIDSIIFVPACGGLFVSPNYGSNWVPIINPTDPFAIDRFANIGSNIFAGVDYSGSSVYLSIDTGISWTPVWPMRAVYAFAVSGTNIFAAVKGSVIKGVYMSSDTGNTWISVNDNLADSTVLSLAIDSTYIFAGTNSSVFRRPLADLIPVSVKENSKNPEVKIYPNPASSTFTISSSIVMKSASIEIFNIVGEKIYSDPLISNQQIINAKAFSGGIYFVKVFDGKKYCCKKIIIQRD